MVSRPDLDAILSVSKCFRFFAPGLNEELVQLLLIRDELHTEQDAMLVDIEDLTRSVVPHLCKEGRKPGMVGSLRIKARASSRELLSLLPSVTRLISAGVSCLDGGEAAKTAPIQMHGFFTTILP